jgi:DNA gyrase subunit A
MYDVSELSIEDLIAEEPMVVTISNTGYIKRTPLSEYRAQRRGGRGKRGMATRDEDFVVDMFVASTHSSILIFTSIGKVYKLKIHELPAGSRTTKGKAIINLIPIEGDEEVEAVLPFEDFEQGTYVLTATRQGVVKKTELVAYQNVHSSGIIALNLREGDSLVDVRQVEDGDAVMLASRDGQAIMFEQSDVRAMGRVAMGVRGMDLREGDEVVDMTIVPADLRPDRIDYDEIEGHPRLLTITENGYGKRTELTEYSTQKRGGKGVITIKTNERNGPVVATRLTDEDDELMLITDLGQIIRTRVSEISIFGRNTQGVRVMSLDDDEHVVGVARILEEEEEEEGELGEEEGVEGAEEPADSEESVEAGDDVEGVEEEE